MDDKRQASTLSSLRVLHTLHQAVKLRTAAGHVPTCRVWLAELSTAARQTALNACANVQVDEEDQEFQEEFLGDKDPSILHFLLASGEEVDPRSANLAFFIFNQTGPQDW